MTSAVIYTIYSLFVGIFVWCIGYWYVALPLVFMSVWTLWGAISMIIKQKRGGK